EDAVWFRQLVEPLEKLHFRAEVLDDRLDDDVRVRDYGVDVRRRFDASENRFLLLGGHLSFIDAALKIAGDRLDGALQNFVGNVDERGGETARGRRVRD